MANLSKAFSVLSRACDRLARMGVTDVHARITARILPPEKCGAEDRAAELAREAIAELHARGLEAFAMALCADLEVPALDPARLAGSTVVDDGFLSPPPIARVLGAAILGASKAAAGFSAAIPDQAHVTPASPLTPEDLEVLPPVPEVPVPPVSHEVKFGEGLGAGVEMGLDLASGPDVTAVVPAPEAPPRHPDQLGYTEAELAEIDRELAAEDAARRAAPVAAEDLEKGDLVALVDGKLVKAAPPAPSAPADRDQAEHIEDVAGGAPEAPSTPSAP